MNAIEIRNLRKTYGQKQAVAGLDMMVPEGAIYGFIGENGSGKSTTEKMICGLIHPDNGGSVKLYGRDYRDPAVREKVGVLIEAPGCFPNVSVWNNLMIQATNLGIENREAEIAKVLKLVRMEGAASNKFRNCSLGMKQRIGIAMALLGDPALLILDEPINGLDTDGMRIMREILVDITRNYGCTVLISSHILRELEKNATHYGIIRQGKMVQELSAKEMEGRCRTFTTVRARNMQAVWDELRRMYPNVRTEVRAEDGAVRVNDVNDTEEIVGRLLQNGIAVTEIAKNRIGLEEYYIELMSGKGATA